MIRKSIEKDSMLPLHALETSMFESLAKDFENWFSRFDEKPAAEAAANVPEAGE